MFVDGLDGTPRLGRVSYLDGILVGPTDSHLLSSLFRGGGLLSHLPDVYEAHFRIARMIGLDVRQTRQVDERLSSRLS
jgi:hypothetical protein